MDWARDIKLFVGDKTAFTSDIVTAGHLTHCAKRRTSSSTSNVKKNENPSKDELVGPEKRPTYSNHTLCSSDSYAVFRPEMAPIIITVHTNCDNIANFRFGAFSAFSGSFKVSVEVKIVVWRQMSTF